MEIVNSEIGLMITVKVVQQGTDGAVNKGEISHAEVPLHI